MVPVAFTTRVSPRSRARVDPFFEPSEDGFLPECAGIDRVSLSDLASQLVENLAAMVKDVLPAESSQQGLRSCVREQPVHGGQFAKRISIH